MQRVKCRFVSRGLRVGGLVGDCGLTWNGCWSSCRVSHGRPADTGPLGRPTPYQTRASPTIVLLLCLCLACSREEGRNPSRCLRTRSPTYGSVALARRRVKRARSTHPRAAVTSFSVLPVPYPAHQRTTVLPDRKTPWLQTLCPLKHWTSSPSHPRASWRHCTCHDSNTS